MLILTPSRLTPHPVEISTQPVWRIFGGKKILIETILFGFAL
jgi:hypothetical protein